MLVRSTFDLLIFKLLIINFSVLTFWAGPNAVILHCVKIAMEKNVKNGTDVEYYQKKELLSMSINV